MRLPRFEYLEPRTLPEACAMLAEHGDKARPVAGGTDLLVLMKLRVQRPQYLVSLKGIPALNTVKSDQRQGLRIGPLVTLSSLAQDPAVRERYLALAQAAGTVAAPNIRNTATIGGNLCLDTKCWFYDQSPLFQQGREPCFKRGGDRCYVVTGGKFCYALVASDTTAALVALDAKVRVVNAKGERTVPVADLFTGRGNPAHTLEAGDIVAEINVPAPARGARSAFLKEGFRGAVDFGIANVAASLTMSDGTCQEARIALTGVTCQPVLARKAAEKLAGQRVEPELAAEAGQEATREVRPISSIWTTVNHRRHVVAALVKRATLAAAESRSSRR